MAAFDYTFVQGLVDFGRGMAGGFVGQPFNQYRLSAASNGNVMDVANKQTNQIRAKVTHGRKVTQMENEYLHTNAFEFLMDASLIKVGDILEQADVTYGNNTQYAVASCRPLKQVVCLRVESLCTIYRPQSGKASGYGGHTEANKLPFVLVNGVYQPSASPTATPTVVPCGIQNIGQLKNQKPEGLPMDGITTWWFIYVPALPGLNRVKEGDIIVQPGFGGEPSVSYKVHTPYVSDAGTRGEFLVAERLTA